MKSKESYIDPNGWEEIQKLSSVERKKYLNKFTKWTRDALVVTMLSLNVSAENIDISSLPHYAKNFFSRAWNYIKKHTHVEYDRTVTDWDDQYNTDYYEKYNTNVKNIENTNLSGIDNLNVKWWVLYSDGVKLSLVSAQNVVEDDRFLKENDLDEVIIRINWTPFKVKPKFLRLFFQASGKKWIGGYDVWKTMTLVYVSYLNKIRVLWTIDRYSWYIDENNPKEYEVLSSVENKKRLYTKISELLWCSECRYKKDYSWNIYFYSNGVNVWILNNMWNEQILTRWNKVLAKIIQHGNNIIMTDSFWNILYKSNWQKVLDIKLPTADEKIVFSVES